MHAVVFALALDIQTKKKEGNSVYYFFKCASDYSRVFQRLKFETSQKIHNLNFTKLNPNFYINKIVTMKVQLCHLMIYLFQFNINILIQVIEMEFMKDLKGTQCHEPYQ